MTPDDARIEDTILALLGRRDTDATLCPSEVARALVQDEAGWRALMPRVRDVAAALARDDRVRLTRGGVQLTPDDPGPGPLRIAHPRKTST